MNAYFLLQMTAHNVKISFKREICTENKPYLLQEVFIYLE
jgi:hypothetical protein